MKRFFYKDDDFQPPYLYMAIYSGLAVAAFAGAYMKIIEYGFASTSIAVFVGAHTALAGLYNWNNKNMNLPGK